ncbi:hypothetical protein M501DRAFT_420531 [Patellaria atrata CBS 101060]|uniref:Uncharacterized protein n=1 Tax=Patellaria atrata CBS 101060 TaxID=1346257 RepID=A0A9P4SHI3_9PEZI|nr:hypothetical protein M501DRAFT_420531 [Patellaria atrata CBS 101060]
MHDNKLKRIFTRKHRKGHGADGDFAEPSSPSSPVPSFPYESTSPGRTPQKGELPIHERNSHNRQPTSSQETTALNTLPNAPPIPDGDAHPGGLASADHAVRSSPLHVPTAELEHLTLGGDDRLIPESSRGTHSEDVADRNIGGQELVQSSPARGETEVSDDTLSANTKQPNYSHYIEPRIEPTALKKRNNSVSRKPLLSDFPAPPGGAHQQSHKTSIITPDVEKTNTIDTANVSTLAGKDMLTTEGESAREISPEHTWDSQKQSIRLVEESKDDGDEVIPRTSLTPPEAEGRSLKNDTWLHPSTSDVVDLSNTKDTTIVEKIVPAVTHETVHPHIHHIREESITREIHNHDVYHRILPVVDVEVLPTKHYIRSPENPTELIQISESQIPGYDERHPYKQNWVIAETLSKPDGARSELYNYGTGRGLLPRMNTFKADEKRYVGEDGVKRTKTTWIHPPTLEDNSRYKGPLMHVHFDEGIVTSQMVYGGTSSVDEEVSEKSGTRDEESIPPDEQRRIPGTFVP